MKLARSLLLATAMILVARTEAAAHMKLTYPADRITTNGQGDPQKGAGPCAAGTMSGMRTVLKAGQEVMVQWTETISHPGHFRIAFDQDGIDDFEDPATITDIVDPPTLPILADGLFKAGHMGGRKLMQLVRLPNVACKTCTLQVLQIMTDNEDVIYRHCADIELTLDNGGGGAGGADGGSKRDAASRADVGSRGDAASRGDAGSRPDAMVPPGGAPTGTGGVGGGGGPPPGYPPAVGTGGSGGVSGAGGSGGAGGNQPMPRAPSPFSFGCSVSDGQGSGLFALGLFAAVMVLARRRRR